MSSLQLDRVHLLPICEICIKMDNNERLMIRIDRGQRPAIIRKEDTVQIYVPLDISVNYQPITQDIGHGFCLKLQRMQQQYKISMQHAHEKKPDFVIFASNLAHEKEIKTTVKEMNTRMTDLSIAGSNLEVSGILRGHNLTFESTVGTMHIYAKITATGSLSLHSQNIVVSTEALLTTNIFKSICRKLQMDGRIFADEKSDSKILDLELSCNLVHIGVDGAIGIPKDLKLNQKVAHLKMHIAGDLANYGKIAAKEKIDLKITGNLLSLSDGSLDSAGRGYDALKKLRKIDSSAQNLPSSSQMHNAIQNQNTHAVANLIEKGVDLNDKIGKKKTIRQSAILEYKEAREKSNRNSHREKITLINALFVAHEWRRGAISAENVVALISRNCEDVAQFSAKNLRLKIGGTAQVEKDSIWSSTWVEMDVKSHVAFHGQSKLKSLILHSTGNVSTTGEAILAFELFARVNCVKFDCSGMWCSGESLVLETSGSTIFSPGSYLESEKLELECKSSCEISGTFQLTSIWCQILAKMAINSDAKIFVEETASISALTLNFSGFCHVTNRLDLILQDSAHFFTGSKLETHNLNLICRGFCTIGGQLSIGNSFQVYVRNDLITTCTGRVTVLENCDVTTGNFKNDAVWQVEKVLKMTTGMLEMSEDGLIFVKNQLEVQIFENSEFSGRLVAAEILLKTLKISKFEKSGLIRCNELMVLVPYVGQSQFEVLGQVDIVAGSLTVSGNSEVRENQTVDPGVILDCNLTAAAIIAPFSAVHVGANAVLRLNGIESYKTEEFNVLVNAGALSTQKESQIISMSDQNIKCEAIICSTVFNHAGQIKFSGQEVNILAPIFIHEGRLTNVENKQNHVARLFINVGELLQNNGIISCDRLEIIGDGILRNTNRIFATEVLDIKLRNFFNNDKALIESNNALKLLAVSKEWTKIGGSIKSKKPVDLLANRLNIAIQNVEKLSIDKRLVLSANSDLLISSDVIDESKELSVGCAAQNSVSIDCNMVVDRLEVLVGSTFAVYQNSNITANTILVNSNSKYLQVLFDGNVTCNRLRFAGNVKQVTIIGSGALQATYMILPGASVSFEMYQVVRIDEIQCRSFDVLHDNILRLESTDSEEITTIVAEDVNIEGTVFLERKLFVKSKEGVVRLNGTLLGSSTKSEIACEASKMVVKGQLGNFAYVELFSRGSISLQNEKIRNVEKLCVECQDLSVYNAEIESCRTISLNCDSITASGHVKADPDSNSTLTIHSTNIHSKMECSGLEKLCIFSKRSATIKGSITQCKSIDIDAKWANLSCHVAEATSLKITAWAVVNNEQCHVADDVTITALSVFVNNAPMRVARGTCHVIATFILSPGNDLCGSTQTTMHSLCLCSPHTISPMGLNYFWLKFYLDNAENMGKITNSEVQNFKSILSLLKDRWMTSSINTDEILLGLKYISDLQEVKFEFSRQSLIYQQILEICAKFENSSISLFNFSELVNFFANLRPTTVATVDQNQKNGRKSKKISSGLLYEALVQFRHGKYQKEEHGNSDSDIGYVSRSSSEDLNSKPTRSRTPQPIFAPLHLENIEEKVAKVEEELENNSELLNLKLESPELDHIAYAIKEEEELAEFEELEDELEMAEEGIVRTDFVVCREKNIYLAKLKRKSASISAPRPTSTLPIHRMPSSNDLIMKKLQVKSAISSLDLRSFGSQSSLTSLDFSTVPDFGSPLQFSKASPFQRSKIPTGSFRNARKNEKLGRVGSPSMYSSSLSRFSEKF